MTHTESTSPSTRLHPQQLRDEDRIVWIESPLVLAERVGYVRELYTTTSLCVGKPPWSPYKSRLVGFSELIRRNRDGQQPERRLFWVADHDPYENGGWPCEAVHPCSIRPGQPGIDPGHFVDDGRDPIEFAAVEMYIAPPRSKRQRPPHTIELRLDRPPLPPKERHPALFGEVGIEVNASLLAEFPNPVVLERRISPRANPWVSRAGRIRGRTELVVAASKLNSAPPKKVKGKPLARLRRQFVLLSSDVARGLPRCDWVDVGHLDQVRVGLLTEQLRSVYGLIDVEAIARGDRGAGRGM